MCVEISPKWKNIALGQPGGYFVHCGSPGEIYVPPGQPQWKNIALWGSPGGYFVHCGSPDEIYVPPGQPQLKNIAIWGTPFLLTSISVCMYRT